MKIYSKKPLRDFKFWSTAKERAEQLDYEELDQIEVILEDLYPDGIDEGVLNDLFWFDFDTICQWLGYHDEEDMIEQKKKLV